LVEKMESRVVVGKESLKDGKMVNL